MRPYKAITAYSSHGSYYIYNIVNYNQFSMVKLNENYVSEILENISCTLCLTTECVEDFVCFFFKPRIVLFEKHIRPTVEPAGGKLNFLKKHWTSVTYGPVHHDNYFQGLYVYTLSGIISNIVVMNNGSCYVVPLLRY